MSWGKYRKVQNYLRSAKKRNIYKQKKNDKDCNKNITKGSYRIKVIDSAKLIAHSLSNIVDNLVEGSHKIKCKDCHCFSEDKRVN